MMKSPFTGKEMMRIYEKRTWNFRGEQFEYYHTAWQCPDTGEQFTTDESDTAGFIQVTNQYRQKYGIPYTDEIIAVRNKYGISAAKMSLILGIGVNQYRLYEKGEVPSVSNGRMIRSIMNPKVMLDMIESSKHELSPQEYAKISEKVKATISESEKLQNRSIRNKSHFHLTSWRRKRIRTHITHTLKKHHAKHSQSMQWRVVYENEQIAVLY
ncbi:MAG: hypothetical protein L6U16_05850 [Porphyromonadaceae bacterium]|nr:MAG: hypothetical protein L6U16_05850 [Porphyromonadaceae bacterium]